MVSRQRCAKSEALGGPCAPRIVNSNRAACSETGTTVTVAERTAGSSCTNVGTLTFAAPSEGAIFTSLFWQLQLSEGTAGSSAGSGAEAGTAAGRQHECTGSTSAWESPTWETVGLEQHPISTPVAAPSADFTAQQQAIGDQIARYTAMMT